MRAFPDKGVKWQMSFGGGLFPKWSRTSKELYFRTMDSRLMAVSYEVSNNSVVPGRQRFVSEAITLAETFLSPNFEITPDGRRFIVLLDAETNKSDNPGKPVNFLLNFFDEVKRRGMQ